jgi:hypothetical protein
VSEANPLTRLSNHRRVTTEAEEAILGSTEPQTPGRPALVEEEEEEGSSVLTPATKAPVHQLTKKISMVEEKKALNVRVPASIFSMVHRHVKLEQANGTPITKDSVVTEAIKLYFGIK